MLHDPINNMQGCIGNPQDLAWFARLPAQQAGTAPFSLPDIRGAPHPRRGRRLRGLDVRSPGVCKPRLTSAWKPPRPPIGPTPALSVPCLRWRALAAEVTPKSSNSGMRPSKPSFFVDPGPGKGRERALRTPDPSISWSPPLRPIPMSQRRTIQVHRLLKSIPTP